MELIYNDAKDKNVSATKVFVKTGDAYAYADAANTEKIDMATLKDVFEKGCVIIDGTMEYSPASLKVAAGVSTITYVKTDGTVATTAVLATLVSKEFV